MAEGVTVANAFVQIMPSMEGATDNITQAILPGVGQAGTQAGAAFGNMFTGKMGALLKSAGAAALGYLAFDSLKDAFLEVEGGFNKVIIATGATGEAAKQLKEVYTEVAGSVYGSFDDIGSAIGALNTRLGLNGKSLEQASEQAMKFAKVNGIDATKGIEDVTRMMNNAGISADEYSHVLDVLTVAAQRSGIDVNKLAETVTANGASFRELGFSTEESIAMLAQFEVAGVNTSQVLAGMKKGVAEWTKEGKSAQEGFAEFVQGVQNGSVTATDAIDLFGAKAGIAMYDAAVTGQLSWDEMYATITESSSGALDSVYNDTLTAQEKFDILGKKIETGFYEIVEPIVDAIEPYMDDIIAAIADGVEWFVNDAVPKIKLFIEIVGTLVNGLIKLSEQFQASADMANQFAAEVQAFFINAVSNIITWWNELPTNIGNALMSAYNWVVDIFNNIVAFVQSIPERIVSFFWGLGSRISSAFGSIHFPTPHVTYWNVSVANWQVPIPYIRWYAKGGIVDGATLIGAGEAGPEMILPKSGGLMDEFAEAVSADIDTKSIVDEISAFRREIGPIIAQYTPGMTVRELDSSLNRDANRQSAGGLKW